MDKLQKRQDTCKMMHKWCNNLKMENENKRTKRILKKNKKNKKNTCYNNEN